MCQMAIATWAMATGGITTVWLACVNSQRPSLSASTVTRRLTGICLVHIAIAASTVSAGSNAATAADISPTAAMTAVALTTTWVVTSTTRRAVSVPEYWVLCQLAAVLMATMATAPDMIVGYLSIEGIALMTYISVGLLQLSEYSTEAALKYYVLSCVASLAFIAAICLVFTTMGTTLLSDLQLLTNTNGWWDGHGSDLLLIAVSCTWAAIAFKLALAPWHLWSPDVLEGSPAVVLAFVAFIPKTALLSLLIKLNCLFQPVLLLGWVAVTVGYVSLFVGGLGAVAQYSWRRMLAFGGTAQLGFAVFAFALATASAVSSAMIHFIAYAVGSFALFTCIGAVGHGRFGVRGIRYLWYLSGSWAISPMLALLVAGCALSLFGMPPSWGFAAKANVIFALVVGGLGHQYALWAMLTKTLSSVYCLRLALCMYTARGFAFASFVLSNVGKASAAFAAALPVALWEGYLIRSIARLRWLKRWAVGDACNYAMRKRYQWNSLNH
nr:NADH dehydrogenase subunit 2 [Rufusia pilicola]